MIVSLKSILNQLTRWKSTVKPNNNRSESPWHGFQNWLCPHSGSYIILISIQISPLIRCDETSSTTCYPNPDIEKTSTTTFTSLSPLAKKPLWRSWLLKKESHVESRSWLRCRAAKGKQLCTRAQILKMCANQNKAYLICRLYSKFTSKWVKVLSYYCTIDKFIKKYT